MAAKDNDVSTAGDAPNGHAHENDNEVATTNGDNGQQEDSQPAENVYQLTINLPHKPNKTQIMVSSQEQMQDIRQSIIEFPHTYQYSCFHLEHNGQRINDFVEISEIPGVTGDSEFTLVEDPYTERDARLHVIRIRELIGAAGDRTDILYGMSAGLTLHDGIAEVYGGSADGGAVKNGNADAKAVADYKFDEPASVKALLPLKQEVPPKTVKSVALSPWHPPPYHLRAKGHLLYLLVTTLEGEQYQITSHISGFYVNKSSNSKFDPFPRTAPKANSAHSLLTLISQLSPSFDSAFQQLHDFSHGKDPLSTFQISNAIPANPWLVPSPSAGAGQHQADITRTQESYLISGVDGNDTLREWNEEFQSTRELPKETVHDRVFRERLTSKLFADYNEAAIRGAVLICRGEVLPLNPTESKDAQIFLYNNIFYSYGVDGVGTFATEGGDEAARVATGKDVMGVKAVNQLDINGLFIPGTVVVDYMGKRLVGQSVVPGIFKHREPDEHQIDYGGVEGKDIVAENEAFVPLFQDLSKALHVKKHPVWDKEGKRHDLEGSVETKGLIGTDGRKYVLDLYRITPLDVNWIEKHWNGAEGADGEPKYPHRMSVLRPELVDSYWRLKLREYVRQEIEKRQEAKKAEAGAEKSEVDSKPADGEEGKAVAKAEGDESRKEQEDQRVDVSSFQFALNPDVFAGQTPQTDEEKAEWVKDEEAVRAACNYLLDEVIPRIIQELQEGDVGFPMDGQSLSSLLHKRGINVRYLGTIAKLADKEDPRLQALKYLSIQEMIARGFKHVASRYMRHLPSAFIPACHAHLLNCFLGTEYNSNPKAEIDEELKKMYPEVDYSFADVTPENLKQEVVAQVKLRYRFDLGNDWIRDGKQLQMLREVALKLGLQLEAKQYAFTRDAGSSNGAAPESNETLAVNGHANGAGKKKKKNQSPSRASQASPSAPAATFGVDDILNIVPVVKEASPRSILAEEALEAGRISIAQDQKELGQELLLESLSLHEQIYGILHPEVARVYYQLSSLYYNLEQKDAAVELARKAVIVSERTMGVDSADTVLSYLNLGLFEHHAGNTALGLAYVRHALDLWKVVFGLNHPDSITAINNAAVMLQSLKLFHESRLWFEASLGICEEVTGKDSINTATLAFQMAQALALDHDSKGAVNRMREAYNIFNKELGAGDRNTKEAETWLEQLTQSAVTIAKQAKDLQNRKLRRIHLTPRVTLNPKPQPQVGQTAAAAVGAQGSNGDLQVDSRKIDDLLRYIEGSDTKKSGSKKKTANPRRRTQKAA